LRAGAEVDALSDEEDGWTPLLMAAQSGHGAVVLALLEAGADSETTLDERYTPLVIAAQSGHEAVVLALLRAGADVEGLDVSYTPQIAAAEGGHEVLAALLHSWTLALDDPERQYFLRLSNLPTNIPIGDPSACFLAHLPTQVLTTIFYAFSELSSSFASGCRKRMSCVKVSQRRCGAARVRSRWCSAGSNTTAAVLARMPSRLDSGWYMTGNSRRRSSLNSSPRG